MKRSYDSVRRHSDRPDETFSNAVITTRALPPRFSPRVTVGTPTYAISDTPFYGIENVEISSARYHELRERQNDEDDSAERLSNEREDSQSLGGKGKDRSEHDKLRDHREHVWAIAHEHEYGPAVSKGSERSTQCV